MILQYTVVQFESQGEKKEFRTSVWATDASHDLAVLQIDAPSSSFTPIKVSLKALTTPDLQPRKKGNISITELAWLVDLQSLSSAIELCCAWNVVQASLWADFAVCDR